MGHYKKKLGDYIKEGHGYLVNEHRSSSKAGSLSRVNPETSKNLNKHRRYGQRLILFASCWSVLQLGKLVKGERESSESWKDFLKSVIVQFSSLSFSPKDVVVAMGVPELQLEPPSEEAA